MKNNCHWDGDKFVPCKPAVPWLMGEVENITMSEVKYEYEDDGALAGLRVGSQVFSYCPFCGASLKKEILAG